MVDLPFERIQGHLNSLLNLECWHIGAGETTGSSFHLALGEKVPRRIPLKNAPQGDEYREYQGEASILVWCSWRLDGPTAPLTSSDEDSQAIIHALDTLIGYRILEATACPPAGDLYLGFSNGLAIRVFCDHIPGDPSFDGNWQIRVRDTIVAAGPGYQWRLSYTEAG